jgi:thiol-disulfide isomerase/thioredoxin
MAVNPMGLDKWRLAWRAGFLLAALATLLLAQAGAQTKPPAKSSQTSAEVKASRQPPATLSKKAAQPRDIEVIEASRFDALVAERRGKPLMVTFWATWCEPCRDEFPMVAELARQYSEKGLAVFGVSLDEDAEAGLARKFLALHPASFPNYRKKPGKEQEFINLVSPRWSGALPATFFYAKDGSLLGHLEGEHPRETFVKVIESLLSRPPK